VERQVLGFYNAIEGRLELIVCLCLNMERKI